MHVFFDNKIERNELARIYKHIGLNVNTRVPGGKHHMLNLLHALGVGDRINDFCSRQKYLYERKAINILPGHKINNYILGYKKISFSFFQNILR